MNKSKKKAMWINIIAQCVLYISVIVFYVPGLLGKEVPDAVLIIFGILDLLTIPAFMYAYVKNIESDSK